MGTIKRTTRPRTYLVINEIPAAPELTVAWITSEKDEVDLWVKDMQDPNHKVTVYELDNFVMHHLNVQAFDERGDFPEEVDDPDGKIQSLRDTYLQR